MRETQARSATHEREARALEMERAEFLVVKIVEYKTVVNGFF